MEGIRDAFNMQLPEWNCRRIGGNMDVRDIWLGRTAPINFPRSFFYVLDREGVPETHSNTVEGRNIREVLIYTSFVKADSPLGIKSLSKREGRWLWGLTIGSVSHSRLVAIHFALVAVVTGVQACNFLGGCVGKGLCHVFVIKKKKMRFVTRELFVHEY